MFYVYAHINSTKNEIFYIGKGKGDRVNWMHGRSKHHQNVQNKYEIDSIILEENLSENEAFDLEKYYIAKIGRKDLSKGTLVNFTDGGDGASGLKWTEARKKEWSKQQLGKKISKEHKENIVNSLIGRPVSEETKEKIRKGNVGKKRTEKQKKNISKAKKGLKRSEEAKKKVSEGITKWWAERKKIENNGENS